MPCFSVKKHISIQEINIGKNITDRDNSLNKDPILGKMSHVRWASTALDSTSCLDIAPLQLSLVHVV